MLRSSPDQSDPEQRNRSERGIVAAMESTLERILEPEAMDTEEEAISYDRMDHSEVNRLLIDRFLELGPCGRILDVGTGPAHIPILLAQRLPGCRVIAIDAAEHMLRIARENVANARLAHRISLELCDAKRLPFPDAHFDAVLSNSIIHHIPDPRHVFREVARVLRPGGALLLRDLHRPRDREELTALVALHAKDADPHQRQLFHDSLHASFTVGELTTLLRESGLAGIEVAKTSDRHWTAWRAAKG